MPKLLIVDDELDVREFAKKFFSRRGIECFTAASGEEALQIFQQQRPNLTLLDIRMEGMNGIEALAEIKKIDTNAKVLMVTGVEEDATTARAKDLGALGYIHKPLVLEELERVVLKEIQ